MRAALEDLKLERLFVLYPGDRDYALDERIQVLAFAHVGRLGELIGGGLEGEP